jgi:peptide deformylase
MILPVYLYNHPILRAKAATVERVDDELHTFIENMFETMRHANGIGLAANQIGSQHALTVIDISDTEEGETSKPLVLINPVIDSYSDEEVEMEEGCLSLPDLRDVVVRPRDIVVRYVDEHESDRKVEATGLLARVIQHEIDHLNGIYFFERLSSIKRALARNVLKKIERGKVIPDYEIVQGKSL